MRILIAEDSGPSRLALEKTLQKWGYEVVSCKDGLSAWEELQKDDPPQLAILDWMMPGFNGPEICKMVRRQYSEGYTYILLLTSKNQREDLIEGLESGADDYVTKPFDHHELNVRLRTGIRILDLQTQLLVAKEELKNQAMRDSLTGLWNRRSILAMLDSEQARSKRQGQSMAVLMMDIDHFKSINDRFGHQSGDEVLREVAKRLQLNVRPYDGVGRYGGEEFMIILPGCDEDAVRNRAEVMRECIASTPISTGNGHLIVTASFGVTVSKAPHDSRAFELIRIADESLYEAKRGGRNRVVYRSPGASKEEPSPVVSTDPVTISS